VLQLLLPLYSGGRVVILPWPAAGDGEALAAAIDAWDASLLCATPTTWQLLLQSGWKGSPRLRACSGGETLHPSLARRLAPRTRELWNHYGPTETTVVAASYRVRGDESRIPIGRAIEGAGLFVLDPDRNPVPAGETGELYISGALLARGYRNRPELTAERFVTLTVEGRPVRAYRTGDLVRYDRGDLQFLGRADNQVKIRGCRVELEEIEAALAGHPGVKQAAVVTRNHGEADDRLVAFVTMAEGSSPDAAVLLDFLERKLPAYMVPRQVLFLEALPATAQGKVDREALRAHPSGDPLVGDIAAAGCDNPLESELLSIWRRIPGFESIGAGDNFFDFGGHSVLAARLMKDVRERFGTAPPLATLFHSPTVKDLARVMRGASDSRPWSPLVPIRAEGSRPPLFCVHGIGGNVLNFERLGRYLPPEQPVYGLQAYGVDSGQPHTSIEAMARSYIEAMCRVQPSGPYLIAGYSAGGVVAFEIARQLHSMGEPVALLVLLDAALHAHPPDAADPTEVAVRHGAGRLGRLARRFKRFRAMTIAERLASLRRNWNYYSWKLPLIVRAHARGLAKRYGVPLPALTNMQDAFVWAILQYRPAVFDGAAVLYRATGGEGRYNDDPAMGWGAITPSITVEMNETTHVGILCEPFVRTLTRSLDQRIREALADCRQYRHSARVTAG
jgi:thioesterase domain-containing protein